MNRQDYYSQTEIAKLLRISPKAVKELISAHQIPVVEKNVDLGMYSVKALYCSKNDVDALVTGIQKP